jgi:hypothetical protein
MNRKQRTLAALVLLFAVAGTSYAFLEWQSRPSDDPVVPVAASTQATTTEPASALAPEPLASDHQFGNASLRLNEAASFPDGLSLRVTSIIEDSRCPANANCVWAGKVRISVRIRSGMGVSTNTFEVGTTITTEAEKITLLSVSPEKIAGREIPDTDYRFTFNVDKRPTGDTNPPGQCYVGGCSAQLCTDEPNIASTCEYRAEYACYRTAECKRQQNGQCGWTETSELRSCLRNPPELE